MKISNSGSVLDTNNNNADSLEFGIGDVVFFVMRPGDPRGFVLFPLGWHTVAEGARRVGRPDFSDWLHTRNRFVMSP